MSSADHAASSGGNHVGKGGPQYPPRARRTSECASEGAEQAGVTKSGVAERVSVSLCPDAEDEVSRGL
jgi:hypothetical protein